MRRPHWGGVAGAVFIVTLGMSGCATNVGDAEAPIDFIYAIDDDPRGMNAQFVGAPMTAMFSAQMLEPLIFQSTDFAFSPALAESWELSDDALTLSFQLREGVTWHDGTPFTADDVKFNFDEIVPLSSFGAEIGERLESVEVTSETTVVIHMSEPYGPILQTVAAQFMVPKHVYEGTDYVTNPANMAPIGTGPLMFDSYDSGEQIVLLRNPDYWGGDVSVDRVIFPIMGDATSRTEALFAGEVDQAVIGIAHQPRVQEDPDFALLETFGYPQDIAMMFNGKSPELEDPAVRQAVFSAIDRQEIAETVLHGLGQPANGFFPEALDWAVSPNVDFSEDFPRDVDAINAALDAAGATTGPDGSRFALDLRYTSERTDTAAMAELARSMLADVGITVNLVGSSATVFTESVYTTSDFDIAFLPATVGSDPSVGITRWYTCNSEKQASANPSQICDEQIDAAAETALTMTGQDERGAAFIDLQDRAEELMIYAPLVWFNGQFPVANTSRWQGLEDGSVMSNRLPWETMTRARG
ncbi:ABC transporter substrate-binding protein [Pseudoclavibacter endophyticus]|uniref:ABC transporter substrate-binding protein n=1 Tax=Pseudoclavibacter endophyticus TaxID=1778590 RepID=UPI001E5D2B14|nr:ABC transporter substrate-binding protein [Pseudoclavibacter endophyticus]